MAEAEVRGRRLAIGEIFYNEAVKSFNGCIYTHVAIFQSSRPLAEKNVKEAWKILSRKQEALQMRIVQNKEDISEASFKKMDDHENISFKVIELETKDSWIRYCDPDKIDRLDLENGPLWQVVYAPLRQTDWSRGTPTSGDSPFEHVMLFRIHHAIADAKSVFDVIYRQYLPILSAIVNGGDPEGIIPFVPLCKSAEETFFSEEELSRPIPWYMKAGLSVLRWYNRMFNSGKLEFKYPDEEFVGKRGQLIPVVFDKDLTSAVLKSAKTNGVSVHSILLGAGAIAVCKVAKDADVKLPRKLKQAWPVDTRKFVPFETPQPLGAFTGNGVTECKQKVDYTSEEFWQLTKEFYEGIKKQIPQYKNPTMHQLLKHLMVNMKEESSMKALGEIGFDAVNMLSNLGNCDVGPEPKMTAGPIDIQLVEHYYTVSTAPDGDLDFTPWFAAVSTFRSRLMMLMTMTGYVSMRFGETYINFLQETLEFYCMGNENTHMGTEV